VIEIGMGGELVAKKFKSKLGVARIRFNTGQVRSKISQQRFK